MAPIWSFPIAPEISQAYRSVVDKLRKSNLRDSIGLPSFDEDGTRCTVSIPGSIGLSEHVEYYCDRTDISVTWAVYLDKCRYWLREILKEDFTRLRCVLAFRSNLSSARPILIIVPAGSFAETEWPLRELPARYLNAVRQSEWPHEPRTRSIRSRRGQRVTTNDDGAADPNGQPSATLSQEERKRALDWLIEQYGSDGAGAPDRWAAIFTKVRNWAESELEEPLVCVDCLWKFPFEDIVECSLADDFHPWCRECMNDVQGLSKKFHVPHPPRPSGSDSLICQPFAAKAKPIGDPPSIQEPPCLGTFTLRDEAKILTVANWTRLWTWRAQGGPQVGRGLTSASTLTNLPVVPR